MYAESFIRETLEKRRMERRRNLIEIEHERFRDICRLRSIPRDVREAIEEAAEAYGVLPVDVVGPIQTAPAVAARRAAIFAVKDAHPVRSITKIGRWFGRDHTTIIYNLASYRRDNPGAPSYTRYDIGAAQSRNNMRWREWWRSKAATRAAEKDDMVRG